jgi:small subunit ribosomal protein S9
MDRMAERREVYVATGKRKTAVARIRMQSGEGQILVNDRALEEYFGRETSRMIVHQPFDVTNTRGQYSAAVNVCGGGVAAQATAIRHGLTRALVLAHPDFRPALKKAGFITRDPREVERKKYGRHKARKRPQYSKR